MAGHVVLPGSGREMAPGYTVKLEQDAGGAIAVFEADHPPGSPGPPRHTHRSYDEAFYVLSGTMAFDIDGELRECSAGTFVWVPHGATHAFHNPTDEPATVLVVVTAAAIPLVESFLALARGGPPDPDEARALMARYDTVLG